MVDVEVEKSHLVKRYYLTETLLQRKCSKAHITEIQKFIPWDVVGRHFTKISRQDLKDIDRDGRDQDHKRDLLLGKVEEKYGDDTTYDLMITTMLKAGNVLQATNVCQLLEKEVESGACAHKHSQGASPSLHESVGVHTPPTYQGLSPGEMLSDEGAEERLYDLNDRFNHMVTKTQSALKESQADPREIINIIRLKDAKMTYTPPDEFFDQFKEAADAIDVFSIFSPYWDHFNYYLYERLILSRSTEELFAKSLKSLYHDLRSHMIQYTKDMDYFRRHTTIKSYCNVAVLPSRNVPKGFKKHIKKQDFKTLQDVEDFRQKMAYEYKLWECLVFVKKIKMGSVIITLWVPDYTENLVPTEDVPVESMIKPSVLMQAIASGDKAKVESLLIHHEADANEYDSEVDFTPLMEACESGNVEIVQLLLENGADPNYPTLDDWTALMVAASKGHYDVVNALLLGNADPNKQDKTGWAALMETVFKSHTDHRIALRIIEAGAIPDIQDKNKTNALLLSIALHDQDVVVDALLEKKPQLNLQDRFGETALMLACKKINVKLVKRLLSMGADPNIYNERDETPVLIAVGLGNIDILEELLKNGANPNIGAEPPLHVACSLETEDTATMIVELLSSYGADINQLDKRGVTAFEIAEIMDYANLSKKLHPHEIKSRASREDVSNSLLSVRKHLREGPLFLSS